MSNEISYLRKEAYTPDEKRYYSIYYYTYKNLQKLLKEAFPDTNRWRRWLTRGWTDGRVIYALDKGNWYSKIGHNRLILHEIGHIEDWGDHRWLIPDLMHPSWLFRWSNRVW
ncbi:hypothetical protein LCGC14_0368290 [marine sediment metagenome]|uniref:Uncharacterized protein n=1 Tax=marine sediment metagenome TaxID=412755 RepID=A0A0F9TNV5_9ZZZZ